MSHFVVPFCSTNKSHNKLSTFIVYFIRRSHHFSIYWREEVYIYFFLFTDFPIEKSEKKCVHVFSQFGWCAYARLPDQQPAREERLCQSEDIKWRKDAVAPRVRLWMHGNRWTVKCEGWCRSMVPSLTCLASTMMAMMMSNNSLYEEVSGKWAVNTIHTHRIHLEAYSWFPWVRQEHDERADDLLSIKRVMLRCLGMILADFCVMLGIRNWTMALCFVCKM